MARAATKAATKARALEQARLRRIELDQERDARDRRIEEGAADVLVLLEQRAEAQQLVERANGAIGEALRRMARDEASVERIAALCDLDVGEVKRLVRAVRAETAAAPDQTRSPVALVDDAARRAGCVLRLT